MRYADGSLAERASAHVRIHKLAFFVVELDRAVRADADHVLFLCTRKLGAAPAIVIAYRFWLFGDYDVHSATNFWRLVYYLLL